MKRSQLIVFYFVFYVLLVLTLSFKLITLEIAKREIIKIDIAINTAGEKTAKVLKDHVYEENPQALLLETFITTFSLCMNETEYYEIEANREIVDRIYIGINGRIIEDFDELMQVKDSDDLAIYIVLKDFTIKTPFRTFVVEREYYKEICR